MLLTAKEAHQKTGDNINAKAEMDLMRAEVAIAEALERGMYSCIMYGYNPCSEAVKRLEELGYRLENFYEDGLEGIQIYW